MEAAAWALPRFFTNTENVISSPAIGLLGEALMLEITRSACPKDGPGAGWRAGSGMGSGPGTMSGPAGLLSQPIMTNTANTKAPAIFCRLIVNPLLCFEAFKPLIGFNLMLSC
jgi:hypothetical protein